MISRAIIFICACFSSTLSHSLSGSINEEHLPPEQSRHIQFVSVDNKYIVPVDTDPRWTWSSNTDETSATIALHAPDHYVPPATIIIQFYPSLNLSADHVVLHEAALTAITTACKNFSSTPPDASDIKHVNFRHTQAFTHQFSARHQGNDIDIAFYFLRFNDGSLAAMTVYTHAGMLPHLEHVINRTANNTSLIADKH